MVGSPYLEFPGTLFSCCREGIDTSAVAGYPGGELALPSVFTEDPTTRVRE